MSILTTLLQVWEKILYLPIWCQNMAGKFDTNVDVGEGIPGIGCTYQLMCTCPIDDRRLKWDYGKVVERKGYHCRWNACPPMKWRPSSHQSLWIPPWASSMASYIRIQCFTWGSPLYLHHIYPSGILPKSTFFTSQGKYYERYKELQWGLP